MISVLKTSRNFSLGSYWHQIKTAHDSMQKIFPGSRAEFFYFMGKSVSDDYFIIRVKNADKAEFKKAVLDFAGAFEFSLLSADEAEKFLSGTLPLDDYV